MQSNASTICFGNAFAIIGHLNYQHIFLNLEFDPTLRGVSMSDNIGECFHCDPVFGKWSWTANGVLFGFYHLHQPWGIVGSIVSGAFFYAFPTLKFRITWMGVIVHSGQSVYLAFLILGVVLGLA
jgi:hypothetical protein